jgi:hypothetical protein
MKEPIHIGYYRLDIPNSGNQPEVNRIVNKFTKRFDEAVNTAIADLPATQYQQYSPQE